MARLIWYTLMLSLGAALVAGVSWVAAYHSLGTLLGAPPPDMGNQSTTFFWQGAPKVPGHPRLWRFAFSPTRIPGAPRVEVYLTPTGRIVRTEPSDLAARLYAFHNPPY